MTFIARKDNKKTYQTCLSPDAHFGWFLNNHIGLVNGHSYDTQLTPASTRVVLAPLAVPDVFKKFYEVYANYVYWTSGNSGDHFTDFGNMV